ncbi:hypothetical protein KAU11_00525 [Candidatus Babeliales bacterium]|nr:hypothetical protein [Candidatus Babeliales bacterium]
MTIRVNPSWLKERKEEIRKGYVIDITTSFNKAAQALIILLKDTPFRVYNLGAGVKRITTKTDICPCCKRKLD